MRATFSALHIRLSPQAIRRLHRRRGRMQPAPVPEAGRQLHREIDAICQKLADLQERYRTRQGQSHEIYSREN
jgi:hypothetical protein